MLFSSISFLYYFLPITIGVYFITKDKYKNLVLLLCSLFFYFYGETSYILLMLVATFSGYIHGILIHKYRKKIFLISSIVVNLGILVIFKYSNFITSNLKYLFSSIKIIKLALPIGISFYTFQILSYVIDVYKGRAKVCKSFINFATYVCLFPQLIAGPIVRYTTIQNELIYRTHSFEKFASGVNRFIIGLCKKIIIANNLGLLVDILSNANEKSSLVYWIIAIAFTLQIYYDFSGYSDMAIGLGRIFGFNVIENFNYPYISKSITEFWRRWHISLSSFFKEYLYIPLGGNRVKRSIWIFNIFIVWISTGLWHGGSWNFVIWGLYFASILVIEKLFLIKILENTPKFVQHIYTILLIVIGFVIFNNNTIKDIFINLSFMFNWKKWAFTNEFTMYYLKSYAFILLISIIGATPLLKKIFDKVNDTFIGNRLIMIIHPIFNIFMLIVVTSYLIDGSFNPFLYFRF